MHKQFRDEFKAKVARATFRGGDKTIIELAAKFEVRTTQINAGGDPREPQLGGVKNYRKPRIKNGLDNRGVIVFPHKIKMI